MQKIFHELLSIEEALKIIEKEYGKLTPSEIEYVDIDDSLGRILADEIYAKVDSPPFDRSEVDGYAVNHEDLIGADEDNPVSLKIIGKSVVGKIPEISITKGTCVEIATGAPIPRGATAVVMVEYTKRIEDEIKIYRSISTGENISNAGSDVMVGDTTLRKGKKISPLDIAIMASLGYEKIPVYKRLSVGIISTGDEVEYIGKSLKPGMIYDSNSHTIFSYLMEIGLKPRFYGIVKDNYDEIKDIVEMAMDENDVVITSGSTSAGIGDLIYRVYGDIGKLIVHGLKIKPGKPTIVAVSGKKLLIGLPGFPMSGIIAYQYLVKPILMKLSGIQDDENKIRAKLSVRVNSNKNVVEFIPVNIIKIKDELKAYPIYGNSGSITSMLYADGIMKIPENVNYVDENEDIEIYLLGNAINIPNLTIIGSHCPLLENLISNIRNVKYIRVGSTAGWYAVKNGEADMAGTHLLDEKTGKYNLPFIEKFGLNDKAVIIRGYGREQGILLKKGNPKNINSVKDFLRDDVTIINRVKGSGTRTLLDILLEKEAEKIGIDFEYVIKNIKGYHFEGKTHSSVASAVSQGRADAGISLKFYAELYGLDFIPIGFEIYDLLVKKDSLDKNEVKEIINLLKSNETAEIIRKKFPGYKLLEDSGSVLKT
ncbi:MAG: molybdopterin biosynthesis protein [Thermoplasmata archaeon]|nr:molybdopterin biosynthesis protein [Thermoplasmata archaeon]